MKEFFFVLTVAESKRLIAKGLRKYLDKEFKEKKIAIAKGSTCSYVAEEFLGKEIKKSSYVIGNIMPETKDPSKYVMTTRIEDAVFDKAKPWPIKAVDSVSHMEHGDIFIKGANILNYKQKKIGMLSVSDCGGTMGAVNDLLTEKKIRLINPVGLEKETSEDITKIRDELEKNKSIWQDYPIRLWMPESEIFTEIEALYALFGIKAIPVVSGGIGGAEGGLLLKVRDEEEKVDKVIKFVRSIQGERPIIEDCRCSD